MSRFHFLIPCPSGFWFLLALGHRHPTHYPRAGVWSSSCRSRAILVTIRGDAPSFPPPCCFHFWCEDTGRAFISRLRPQVNLGDLTSGPVCGSQSTEVVILGYHLILPFGHLIIVSLHTAPRPLVWSSRSGLFHRLVADRRVTVPLTGWV